MEDSVALPRTRPFLNGLTSLELRIQFVIAAIRRAANELDIGVGALFHITVQSGVIELHADEEALAPGLPADYDITIRLDGAIVVVPPRWLIIGGNALISRCRGLQREILVVGVFLLVDILNEVLHRQSAHILILVGRQRRTSVCLNFGQLSGDNSLVAILFRAVVIVQLHIHHFTGCGGSVVNTLCLEFGSIRLLEQFMGKAQTTRLVVYQLRLGTDDAVVSQHVDGQRS